MPTIVTGRQRTLKFSGTIAGTVGAKATILGPRRTQMDYQKADFFLLHACKPDAFAYGPSVWASNTLTIPAPLSGVDTGYYEVTLDCHTGCVSTYSDSDTTGLVFWSGDFDYPLDGTWTVELDVEEVMVVDDSSTDWPSYGGTAPEDGPFYTTVRFAEQLRLGGTVSVTATVGTLSVSAVSTIGAMDVANFGEMQYNCQLYPTAAAANTTSTCSLTATFMDVENLTAPYSSSMADGSVSAENGASATVNSSGFGYSMWTCQAQSEIKPLLQYRLVCRTRSFEDAYDGNPEYKWEMVDTGATYDVAGNAIQQDVDLENWACGGEVNGVDFPPDSHLEWDRTRCYLSPTWLAGSGEDDRDWRCLWQGKPYAAFSLVHDSALPVDDGASVAPWSNTANCTITGTGTAIRIAVSGGTGSCSRAIPS